MARMVTSEHVQSGSLPVVLLSGAIGLTVFGYLTVTAVPSLGVGEAVPTVASRSVVRGLLFSALVVSLVTAYRGGSLAASLVPLLAMALGMSAFLVVDAGFALDAVEADLPIQFGVVFYVVAALVAGVGCYLVGRGGRWLRARNRVA